jgi:carotenoid cleavage dioxygenase
MSQAMHESPPFWMRGNLGPVNEEVMAFDLEVDGEIPQGLNGLYARNGPNPRRGVSGHWFLGDGMLHAVSLRDGQARWYRNRWVRTPRFAGEPRTPDTLWDLNYALANTNVIAHGGRILALVENALPYELDAELETRGPHDFAGKLATPFTAHPKICPITGEMHFEVYCQPWTVELNASTVEVDGTGVRRQPGERYRGGCEAADGCRRSRSTR